MNPTEPAGRLVAGRYAPKTVLRSGTVSSFLATDVPTGEPVFLKTASIEGLSSTGMVRLEHEATVLRRLDSKYLAPLRAVGVDAGTFYVVTPFVEGPTLEELLKRCPPSVPEAISIARCVTSALAAAHEIGVLHCDVKPGNIIVRSGGAGTEAVLVDFGFSRSVLLPVPLRDEAVGTVSYMSPEQAGLLHQPVDERADLYGLGVVLFECLAGHRPFEGPALADLLRQHLSAPVPTLRGLGSDVPRAVEEVVQRLLQKSPSDRYQSARALHDELGSLEDQLLRGIAEPQLVVGSQDARVTLTEPAFIGREDELVLFDHELDEAFRGAGRLVILEAESGGGKTRTLEEFERRAGRRGGVVLRGQALSDAPDRPFRVFTGVILDLLAEAQANEPFAKRLREELRDHREILSEMLPELREVLPVPESPPGHFQRTETAALWAMTALIDALGSPDRPAIVLFDDCQWADELSSRFLRFWQGAPRGARDRHVLIVGAFRSGEAKDAYSFGPDLPVIRLDPLNPDEVTQLAESMAGPLPEATLTSVSRLADGNPFVALAVLRGLVESEVLVPQEGGGWRLNGDPGQLPQSSRQAAVFLTQRLNSLPGEALRLLSAAAVLGREFDLDLAARLANQDAETAFLAVEDARRRHLVWIRSRSCAFVHDRVREAILARLEPATRAGLHLRAAEAIGHTADSSYDLAYHYDAAGHFDAALPYALTAAQLARSRFALESAERQLRIAERGLGPAPAGLRLEVTEALGQVLTLRGRYEEAARYLTTALELAGDDVTRARLEGQLGEVAFKRGDIPAARARIEKGLRLLGKRMPRRRSAVVVCLLWEVGVQCGHVLLARVGLKRTPRGSEDQRLAARLYHFLLHPWWFGRSTLAASWVLLKQLNEAERHLGTSEVANASAVHAATMVAAFPSLFSRGDRYSQRAMETCTQMGDISRGKALGLYRAAVLVAASRYSEAIECCDQAVHPLERTGEYWELNTARWHKALSLYRLGELDAAARESQEIYATATRRGDKQAAAIAVEIWAKASRGNVPRELIEQALRDGRGDVHSTAAALQAEAIGLLRADRIEDATRVLETAEDLIDAAGVKNVYVCSLLPWLATARRMAVTSGSPFQAARRRAMLRAARRSCRRARRYAYLHRADLPHAMRESAYVAALDGADRRARRFLRKGMAEAVRQGARAEQEEMRRAEQTIDGGLGQGPAGMGGPTGWTASSDQAEPIVTPGLSERFETLLAAGRRMTSAATVEDVVESVRVTVMELVRAEQCVLIDVSSADGPGLAEPTESCGGQSLVEAALTAGQAVTRNDVQGAQGSATDSMILTGIRSALCVPVFVGNQPWCCVLATHSRVPGLFGEEEERLANFIATLAGAAMERALQAQEIRKQVIGAQEQERARVARDLHDEVGQTLTSLLIELRLISADLDRLPSPGRESVSARVSDLRDATAGALRDVRRLAFELRPMMLDDLGLVSALRRLTSEVASRHGFTVQFAVQMIDEKRRFHPDAETAVYRVAQEALTNVVRHAAATGCSVVLTWSDHHLRLIVEDDGCGFASDAIVQGSFGLRGMKERAALVGGSLAVSASPEGTSVVLEVPVD